MQIVSVHNQLCACGEWTTNRCQVCGFIYCHENCKDYDKQLHADICAGDRMLQIQKLMMIRKEPITYSAYSKYAQIMCFDTDYCVSCYNDCDYLKFDKFGYAMFPMSYCKYCLDHNQLCTRSYLPMQTCQYEQMDLWTVRMWCMKLMFTDVADIYTHAQNIIRLFMHTCEHFHRKLNYESHT